MTATPEEVLEAMAVHFDAANGDVVGTPYSGTVDGLRAALRAARDLGWKLEDDTKHDALMQIKQWCDAFPLDVFPEPDLKRAAAILKEHGMTLDAISASNMRHALTGVAKIADAALAAAPDLLEEK